MAFRDVAIVAEPPAGLLAAGASPDLVATMYAEYYRALNRGDGASSVSSVGIGRLEVGHAKEGGVREWRPVSPESSVSQTVSPATRSVTSVWESVAGDIAEKLSVAQRRFGQGYCYLAAVKWESFDVVSTMMGSCPSFRDLVALPASQFEDDAYLASLRVDVVEDVAHVVSRRAGGTTFLTLCRSCDVGEFDYGPEEISNTLVGRVADMTRCGATFVNERSFRVGARTNVELRPAFDVSVGDDIYEVGYVSCCSGVGREFSFIVPALNDTRYARYWKRPSAVLRVTVDGRELHGKYMKLDAGAAVNVDANYALADFWVTFLEVGKLHSGKPKLGIVNVIPVIEALTRDGGPDLEAAAKLVYLPGVVDPDIQGKWCTVVVRGVTFAMSCRFPVIGIDGHGLLAGIAGNESMELFDDCSVVHSGDGTVKSVDLVSNGVRCHVVLSGNLHASSAPTLECGDFPRKIEVVKLGLRQGTPLFSVEGADRVVGGSLFESIVRLGELLKMETEIELGKWSREGTIFDKVKRVDFKYASLLTPFSLVWHEFDG